MQSTVLNFTLCQLSDINESTAYYRNKFCLCFVYLAEQVHVLTHPGIRTCIDNSYNIYIQTNAQNKVKISPLFSKI